MTYSFIFEKERNSVMFDSIQYSKWEGVRYMFFTWSLVCNLVPGFLLHAVVARKKSLFDDKPEEIQKLTLIIKQDINVLNSQIAQLQEASHHLYIV